MSEWPQDQRDKGIPNRFPPPEKSYSLYEGVDYQEHWGGTHQERQDALERHILSHMLPVAGRRIIDLGCGYGRLAPVYLGRFDQVVLYDGSVSLLKAARDSLGKRAVLVAGDFARLPFKAASFDCVLSIRVLQHIGDLPSALEGTRRVLSGGGQMVFSYYNKRNVHRMLHYIRARRSGDPFSLESAEISPTMIAHHPTRFATLLRDAGFSAAEYRGAVVVDSVANLTDRFGREAPAGAGWATLMGRLRLAPWLIGRATAEGDDQLIPADSIDDLFSCPICRSELDRSDGGFTCSACDRGYPIDEGIFDFRA